MDSKYAAGLVLVKMALSDGVLSSEEKEELSEFFPADQLDSMIKKASEVPLTQLTSSLVKYEDRFFVCMRAYAMAHSDCDFDSTEQALFEQLIEGFNITPEDRSIIEDSIEELTETQESDLEQHIQNSSFAEL